PGAMPPTTCVPYSRHWVAWKVPALPRPWQRTRVFLSTRMLMRDVVPLLRLGRPHDDQRLIDFDGLQADDVRQRDNKLVHRGRRRAAVKPAEPEGRGADLHQLRLANFVHRAPGQVQAKGYERFLLQQMADGVTHGWDPPSRFVC